MESVPQGASLSCLSCHDGTVAVNQMAGGVIIGGTPEPISLKGNITKDGIAKDMAWMKRVGIGGLQNFDANLQTPQIVEKRLVYMTPEWKDACMLQL